MDGLLLAASLREIETDAVGAIVEQIHMPLPDSLLITLYRPGIGRLRLFIQCHPSYGRMHLTSLRPDNPPQPPDYCMLLRKHLKGKRLVGTEQRNLDRLVFLNFGTGMVSAPASSILPERRLVVELMGKRVNALLLDGSDGVIGALHRRSDPVHDRTSALGLPPYEPPAPTGKLDLRTISVSELTKKLADCPSDRPSWRAVLTAVEGPGPTTCRELVCRAGTHPETKWGQLSHGTREILLSEIIRTGEAAAKNLFTPSALSSSGPSGNQTMVSSLSLACLAAANDQDWQQFSSVQLLCDEIYAAAHSRAGFQERQRQMLAQLRRLKERASRKLLARQEDLDRGQAASDYRLRGELLLAHLHEVPRGAHHIQLPNYHDPQLEPLQIPLDPALSPTENAQRYFDRARRLDRTRIMAERFRQEAQDELDYLSSIEASVENADDLDTLLAIGAELLSQGFQGRQEHRQQKARQRRHRALSAPHRESGINPLCFVADNGWKLYVGRHNRENDYLTFRLASADDWWFHVKDEAGSHVIAKAPGGHTDGIPDETIEQAALLAAYYSRARHGQNVPVDYTRRRFVSKPRGARPGNVNYTNHRTTFVTPDAIPLQLRRCRPPQPNEP